MLRWSMMAAQPPWLSHHPPGFSSPQHPHGPQATCPGRGPYEQQLMIQSYRMHVVWFCLNEVTEASAKTSPLSHHLPLMDLQYPVEGENL